MIHNLQLQTMLIYSFVLLSYTSALWVIFYTISRGRDITQTASLPQVFSSTILGNLADHWTYFKALSDSYKTTLAFL